MVFRVAGQVYQFVEATIDEAETVGGFAIAVRASLGAGALLRCHAAIVTRAGADVNWSQPSLAEY